MIQNGVQHVDVPSTSGEFPTSTSQQIQPRQVDPLWYERKFTAQRAVLHTRGLSRIFHWGPLGTLVVVSICAISGIYCHLSLWPLEESMTSILTMIIFLYWVYATVTNLFDASTVGPGYVPEKWRPLDENDEKRLQYCTHCSGYKSPRSHHCRICNRCVMKMDHHCPWINNCVGYANHLLFMKFLFYAVIGCVHATIILAYGLWYGLFRMWYALNAKPGTYPIIEFNLYSLFVCVFAFGLAVGVIIAVGFLFIVQFKIAYRNKTNVEDYIIAKADARKEDDEQPFIYPYDLGWKDNLRMVLWRDDILKKHLDGFHWPVVIGTDQFTFTQEQLMQKADKRERARAFKALYDYSGAKFFSYSLLLRLGCWGIFKQPKTDGNRLKFEYGDVIAVTRGSKYWLYGEKMDSSIFADVTRESLINQCKQAIGDADQQHANLDEAAERLNAILFDELDNPQRVSGDRGWFPRPFAVRLEQFILCDVDPKIKKFN